MQCCSFLTMLLEICVDSVESAINAEKGGADRLELCSSLCLGGLTPSVGLLKAVKRHVSIPVFCMIRPRHGNFTYTPYEVETMKMDILSLKTEGADGFVFGILTKNGSVNKDDCKSLVDLIPHFPVTFHRAFDLCLNWKTALEDIIELKFDRILTSGQAAVAVQGVDTLRDIIKQAENRITIMIGSGLNENNVSEICKLTKAPEYHGSASVIIVNGNNSASSIAMGILDETPLKITDAEKVEKMKKSLCLCSE